MCSSPECRVEVLPDGQIDETHVFTEEDMRRFGKSLRQLQWKLDVIEKYGPVGFQEVSAHGSNAGS